MNEDAGDHVARLQSDERIAEISASLFGAFGKNARNVVEGQMAVASSEVTRATWVRIRDRLRAMHNDGAGLDGDAVAIGRPAG